MPPQLKLLSNYLPSGYYAVRLFFVISGFIITHLLLKEESKTKISLLHFYIRRTLRILPAYYIYISFIFFYHLSIDIPLKGNDWLPAITFTTGVWGEGGWLLGHLWSLAVEEQFYLFWPFFFILLSFRSRQKLLVGVLLLMPLIRICINKLASDHFSFPFIFEVDFLAAGCLLAFGLRNVIFVSLLKKVSTFPISVEIILCLTIWWGCILFDHKIIPYPFLPFFTFTHRLLMALFVGLVVLSPRGIIGSVLNNKPLVWIGSISYSLYLWQQFFTQPQPESNSFIWLSFPLNMVMTLLAATLSYYLIEKPFLNMRLLFSKIKHS